MNRKDTSGPWNQAETYLVPGFTFENCLSMETIDEAILGAYSINRFLKAMVEQTQSKRTN